MENRLRAIKIASWVGIIGNILLALTKISLGLVSGSLAVVGDGIDSTTDILSFLIILFATHIISKAPDKTHSYGHHRAESLATIIISFIIFFVGAQLFISSIAKILSGTQPEIASTLAIIVTLFSVTGKILLAAYQFKVGKITSSAMLTANSHNMLGDIFISLGVLSGLLFTAWLKQPLIDSWIALLVSIWIMRTAVRIFINTNIELMEGFEDTSLYNKVFAAVDEINGVTNPHRTRIRKLANLLIIDIDIEVDGNLSVTEGHNLAIKVEEIIRQKVANVYDLSVHVEPRGNIETKERYGLSAHEMQKKD